MGFKAKFGLLFLEAIRLAPQGCVLADRRIWDREILRGSLSMGHPFGMEQGTSLSNI